MYCTCSNKNNYEVITPCDIKKFTDKNGPFNNKPWVQISIADVLMLDCNKLAIEKIEKIYIDVSITNTKIIETPISPTPNSEGMTLTGKKLLIDGFICSKIVYTSLTMEQAVYTSNFVVPFCTYIVIEENADAFNDTYCIKTCIEDVFLSLVDCKTIFQNVTLFLLAKRTSFTCAIPKPPSEDCTIVNPPNANEGNIGRGDAPFSSTPTNKINKLPNDIILNDVNNIPVIIMSFYTSSNEVVVNSTGRLTDPKGGTNYFNFILYEADGIKEKLSYTLSGNSTGIPISNTKFQYKDIIKLQYEAQEKIKITNFPNLNAPMYTPKELEELFIITEKGLAPHHATITPLTLPKYESIYVPSSPMLQTAFIFKSLDGDKEMARIEFNKITKRLVVTSTEVSYNGKTFSDVFTFKLKNGTNIKVSSYIEGNGNANYFRNILNNNKFDYGDTIDLKYLDNTKVILANFPNMGDIYTMPYGIRNERFTITEKGVIPSFTPNKITIKSNTNEEVLSIQFTELTQQIIVSSSGVIPDISSTEVYFTFILKDENGKNILKATLNSNEPGNILKSMLNGKRIEFGINNLILIYKDKSKIEISNYPTMGNIYNPNFQVNAFKVLINGLEDLLFNSKIRIINDNNTEISSLSFMKPLNRSTITMLTTSTKDISTNKLNINDKYIEYVQYSLNNITSYTKILSENSATDFANNLNDKLLEIPPYFDVFRISSRIPNRVIINNYKGETQYKIGEEPEFFQVTSNELVPHNLQYNKIRFKNKDESTVLFIYFDKIYKNILYIQPYSTGIINNTARFFSFKILDSTETNIKFEGRINRNDTGDVININPPYNISNKIEFGDILELSCSNRTLVEIFPPENYSQKYNISDNIEKFEITEKGLISIPYLPNSFLFNSFDNKEMAKVSFNKKDLKILATSTGVSYNGKSNDTVFKFQLISADETLIKASAYILGTDDGNIFRNKLNGISFKYNDLILINFLDSNKVFLENYPYKRIMYQMKSSNLRSFKITEFAIIPYILPNEIRLNDSKNTLVMYMQFDILAKKIIVYNIGTKTNVAGGANYFLMSLYENDGKTLVKTSSISGSDDGTNFVNAFNSTHFEFGYIIKLQYEEEHKVKITNFPNKTTPLYTPIKSTQSFKITKNGLAYTSIDSQEIIFGNIGTLKFDSSTKRLVATYTGSLPDANLKNTLYYSFKLRDSYNNIKRFTNIKSDENANFFKFSLNNANFDFGNIIEIGCLDSKKIEIKNFPKDGESSFIDKRYFNMDTYQGFFRITEEGLKDYNISKILPTPTLPNTIKINKIDGSDLIYLIFNTLDKAIETFSFGKFADMSSKYDYFTLKLFDASNKLIVTSTLPSNDLPNSVNTNLNLVKFDDDYIIELTYDIKAKKNIVITNLQGEDHIPYHSKERYFIGPLSLYLIPIFLPNIIIINDIKNEPVVSIEFDIIEKKFKAFSFNTMADADSKYDYVIFNLYNLTDIVLTTPIFTFKLQSNNIPNEFVELLNNTNFIYGYILEIYCHTKALYKVDITNFKVKGQTHTIGYNQEVFKITKNGLESFTPTSVLKDTKIIIRSLYHLYDDTVIITFDTSSKKIKATANEYVINRSTMGGYAFSYKLKSNDGTLKKEDYLRSYDPSFYPNSGIAIDLANSLNDTPFEFGDNFEIYAPSKDYNSIYKTTIFISNVPFKSNIYCPFNDTETYTISNLGLLLQPDSPLGNTSILRNVITLNNIDNQLMLQIYFDIKSKTFLVSYSNIKTQSRSNEYYFLIVLSDKSGKEKDKARVMGNVNAEYFAYALNKFPFEFGDILTLKCKELNKVSISNFPNYNETYTPLLTPQNFYITNTGLIQFPLKNIIIFKDMWNEIIVIIGFDSKENKLIVYSTGKIVNRDVFSKNITTGEYFAFVLMDNLNNIKQEVSVASNENADIFAKTLNELPFEYYDTITLRFKEGFRVSISNYINEGAIYIPPNNNPKTFIIKPSGLGLKY